MSVGELASADTRQWIWDRSAGYRPLARFASVSALRGLALHDRDAYQVLAASTAQTGANTRESVRETTRGLYEQLRSRHYPYAAPWAYRDNKQRIRDPVIIHQDSGTCLDLSLLFAAMCTAVGLRVFIVVLERDYDIDHALVLVDLASTPSGIGRPSEQGGSGLDAPVVPEEASAEFGVRQLAPGSDPVNLTPDGIAVEVTAACGLPGLDFTQACQLGAERLTGGAYQRVYLIDVLICRDLDGEAPLPEYRPAIYPSLPPMPPFTTYSSREKTEADLRSSAGTVVILGDSGTGKSMLAHRVAATVDHGSGWLLDASSQQALTVALAAEDARATGKSAEYFDAAELKLLARASLDRLMNSCGPWAVVLDNANEDPGHFNSLPEPNGERGQLLIITTTNEKWDDDRRTVIRLPALPPSDVAASLNTTRIPVEAIAGRPLFIDASRRFYASTGRWWWTGRLGTATSAATDLWQAAAQELGDSVAREVAQAISWLPPVRLPIAALTSVGGTDDARTAVTLLGRLGLVDEAAGEVTMHRLFRSAVRESALRESLPDQVDLVTRLLGDEHTQNVMKFAADLESARHMGEILETAPGLAAVIGLYQLGKLFERHGTAADSATWYSRFTQRAGWQLGEEVREELRVQVANALVGMARAAMRGLSGSPQERMRSLDTGIRWTKEAERLCQDRRDDAYDQGATHAKAMRGLLLRKRASLEPDGSAAGLAFLRDAESALRESYEERRRQFVSAAISPELDRSQYNLAGLEVRLAQRDEPANTAAHLDEAWWHYTEVLRVRRQRYRTDDLEEVVCCINGQAIVDYYRAAFVKGTFAAKTAWLRSAAERIDEAVAIRQRLAGSADDPNTSKSLTLQAKIALMRLAVIEADGRRADRYDTAIEAFRRENQRFGGSISSAWRSGRDMTAEVNSLAKRLALALIRLLPTADFSDELATRLSAALLDVAARTSPLSRELLESRDALLQADVRERGQLLGDLYTRWRSRFELILTADPDPLRRAELALSVLQATQGVRAWPDPSDPGPGGGTRQRKLRLGCPEAVQLDADFGVTALVAVVGEGSLLKSFPVPAHGRDVVLDLEASGLLIRGPHQQCVRVPPDADSEPVRFELRATRPGMTRISITAWLDGSFLGEVTADVAVSRDAPRGEPQSKSSELGRIQPKAKSACLHGSNRGATSIASSSWTAITQARLSRPCPGR